MKRFFIVGCQRTGTTLVRLILGSHPAVHCYDEQHSYAALRSGVLPGQPGPEIECIGFKIPRWTEQLAADYISDRVDFEGSAQFYRHEPIVFLLRGVRDTVASMMRLRAGDSSWLCSWGIRILEARIRDDPGFAARYADELSICRDSAHQDVALGALYWKAKTLAMYGYLERGWPVVGIRYEDLARSPGEQVSRIAAQLGLKPHPDMLRHHTLQHTELSEQGLAYGGTDPGRPVDARSVGIWRTVLAEAQAEVISAVAGDLEERFERFEPVASLDAFGVTRALEADRLGGEDGEAGRLREKLGETGRQLDLARNRCEVLELEVARLKEEARQQAR